MTQQMSAFHHILSGHAKVNFSLIVVLVAHASLASGQTSATNAPAGTNSPAVALENTEKKWAFSALLSGNFVPDSRDYVQPTLIADHGLFHLEARYNYENLETGSAWLGCNFGAGKELTWEFTPMIGGVFGNTTGIAPGFRGFVRYWKMELYGEGEYLVDPVNPSNDFFFLWTELTLSPLEWLRFGLVTQRTKAYQTDRDTQRGFLVGLMLKHVDLTTYVLNPDDSKPTVIIATAFHW